MQTEKTKLTKREKRLLFAFGCIGFLAIMIMLVILPLNNRLTASTLQHNELVAQQIRTEAELAAQSEFRTSHQSALAEFEQIRSIHKNESLSSEIGLMLTQKVTEHNLEPISQNISQPTDFVVPIVENEEGQSEPIFKAMSVTMVVAGEYNDVRSLLNSVEDTQYLRIGNVALTFPREDTTATSRINIRFDILMLRDGLMEEES